MCGFDPIVTQQRRSNSATNSWRNRPQMVALDLGMPGMDGVELLRFLADEDYRRARC